VSSNWWFYVKDGRQESVHGLAALVEQVRSGAISPWSFVWREGLAEWRPAADVDELKELLAEGSQTSPPAPS
jgi:hypothetical protein